MAWFDDYHSQAHATGLLQCMGLSVNRIAHKLMDELLTLGLNLLSSSLPIWDNC